MRRGHIDLPDNLWSGLTLIPDLRISIPAPPRRLACLFPVMRTLHIRPRDVKYASTFAPTLTYFIAHAPQLESVVCQQEVLESLSAWTSPSLQSGRAENKNVKHLRLVGYPYIRIGPCEGVKQLCDRLPGLKRLSQTLHGLDHEDLVRPHTGNPW